MIRTSILATLLALESLAMSRSAAATVACPTDSMRFNSSPITTSTAATFDSTVSAFGTFHVAWDLPAGRVHFDQCCTLSGAWVKVADAYDVTGVPAGTPVAVTALLAVDGSVSTTGCGGSGCGGYYLARLEHGAVADQVEHSVHLFNGSESFHDVLLVPLTIVAGSPELLFASAWGARSPGGSHASEATGVLTFTGLPAGASIVSCQGYGSSPTPARGTSWGRLKTIYR